MIRIAPSWQPHVWTLAEYLALPEAHPATGACPNCPGRHYGAINVMQNAPNVYRCHGTDTPNMHGYPYVAACGTLFRGRPGEHFDALYYADFFAGDSGEPGE